MSPLDLIRETEESERYPALLAWFHYAAASDGDIRLGDLLECIREAPEPEGSDIVALYEGYLERGEIAAAQFLSRRYRRLGGQRVLQRKDELTAQLEAESARVRSACMQLARDNRAAANRFSKRLERILDDPLTLEHRPGLALRAIIAISHELQVGLTAD